MDDLLKRLEKKIEALLKQYEHLKDSNQQLNQGKVSLAREKDLLLDKQKKAAVQIEMLVSKLKSIEE